jgi:hypothetical protein
MGLHQAYACRSLPSAGGGCSALGLRGLVCPPQPVSERADGCEPETLLVLGAGPGGWRDTCAGGKQEVTAGVERPSGSGGADGSGVGAREAALVSRLFSPSAPVVGLEARGPGTSRQECGTLGQRPGACQGMPLERRGTGEGAGRLWQVAEEGGGPVPSRPLSRLSWRQ